MRGKCLFSVIIIIYLDITNTKMTIARAVVDYGSLWGAYNITRNLFILYSGFLGCEFMLCNVA